MSNPGQRSYDLRTEALAELKVQTDRRTAGLHESIAEGPEAWIEGAYERQQEFLKGYLAEYLADVKRVESVISFGSIKTMKAECGRLDRQTRDSARWPLKWACWDLALALQQLHD